MQCFFFFFLQPIDEFCIYFCNRLKNFEIFSLFFPRLTDKFHNIFLLAAGKFCGFFLVTRLSKIIFFFYKRSANFAFLSSAHWRILGFFPMIDWILWFSATDQWITIIFLLQIGEICDFSCSQSKIIGFSPTTNWWKSRIFPVTNWWILHFFSAIDWKILSFFPTIYWPISRFFLVTDGQILEIFWSTNWRISRFFFWRLNDDFCNFFPCNQLLEITKR